MRLIHEMLVVGRVLLREDRGHARQVGVRGVDVDTRSPLAHEHELPIRAVLKTPVRAVRDRPHHRVHAERHEDLRRHQSTGSGEAARRDTDDGQKLPVHPQSAAEEVVRASQTLEQLEAQDGNRLQTPRPLLLSGEEAAGMGHDAEGVEEVGGDDVGEGASRRTPLADADEAQVVSRDAVERPHLPPQVDEGGVRDAVVAVDLRIVLENHGQPLRVGDGKRPQQERVDEAQHGAVGADAESENDDRAQRRDGRPP